MARRPPRVTSTRRQPTTRGGPRVTSRASQPTTGRGRIVRGPVNPFVSRGTLAGMRPTSRPPTAGGGGPPPAVPAAPAPYSASNLPPDASFDATMAGLARQRDEQIAALAQQRHAQLL